jgi:glycine dehydrogenase subunit 2
MEYKQANWNEPTIFEISKKGKIGYLSTKPSSVERELVGEATEFVPDELLRKKLNLPQLSEVEVLRHYFRLSQQNFGVDSGMYPLGSCTMKYNPKICDVIANSIKIQDLHPLQDASLTQGILKILYDLSLYLAEITGMQKFSLQPAAGAHGEFVGAMIIRAYHKHNKDLEKRNEIIIPDSAHGTNPASANMAGFNVVVIPSEKSGRIDIKALESAANENTAGLMLTNPNTLGIFEKEIIRISEIIHSVGGLLYYDGANLNALLGKVRPGDMGFDIVHLNMHKTFATPHGGGGPGAGPVGVVKELEDFLPVPTVEFNGKKYYLDNNKSQSIGKVRSFYGNISVLLKAYTYILCLGKEGLKNVAEISVLNANYVARKLLKNTHYEIPFYPNKIIKHEFVLSAKKICEETGINAMDISKRLLDYGYHPPTVYFPQIVNEAMMIEPTETESKEQLDNFIQTLIRIGEESYSNSQKLKDSPGNTATGRIDEVKASNPKTLCLSWKMRKDKGLDF